MKQKEDHMTKNTLIGYIILIIVAVTTSMVGIYLGGVINGREDYIKRLEAQLEEAPKKQTLQISATLQRYAKQCEMKAGGAFPVITDEPYNVIRLRCFQFWKGNSGSWTELKMNPTFGLPTN